MPSLFPQNICLTAWNCLRAEYLFTAPARLGGAKGTVSCGSSPGSPWKRRLSSPLSSGLVVASGTGQMLLMQCGFLSPDKTPVVTEQERNPQFFKTGHMYKSQKKKFWEQLDFFLQIQWKFFVLEFSYPNDVLPQLHLAAIFVTSGSNRIHIALKVAIIFRLLLFKVAIIFLNRNTLSYF